MNDFLNKLLSELADEIDISNSQEVVIMRAYNSVANWLNQNDTSLAKHNVHIFPQGSMMYGTAIKPIDENDYDVDLVCEFKDYTDMLTPNYVKNSVGQRLNENKIYSEMLQPEGRRCWTLEYSDELNFHMDILPAIPFHEQYSRLNNELFESFNKIAIRKDLALLATDKNKISKTYRYIPTNPGGYAEWFKEKIQLHNTNKPLVNSIENVPTYPKKTILQKAIQLLKRHRDVYFSSRDDSLKPISMIITTLVAYDYNGETDLYGFICQALTNMPSFIERDINGAYIIRNPVMSNENFADKWKEQPEKATAFFEWLQNAYIDFTNLDEYKKFSDVERIFKDLFSQKPVERLMKKYEISLIREKREVSVLSHQSPSIIALERLPHRKTPPWVLPRNFRVGIQGKISYDNGITYQHFSSGTILPKGASLEFYPIHTIPSPYKIKWQVTNTGEEAREANSLRGDEFENPNLIKNGFLCGKKEVTSYTGTHYVQCFIIKNGNQCVGLSKPFIVKIK